MSKVIEGIVVAVIGGVVTAALIAAIPSAFKWLISPSVPSGAVIAFDRPCSDGWEPYVAAGGKVIIGAGEHPNSEISTYKMGATGGEEKHKLTVDEMPPHKHTYYWQKDSSGKCGLSGCGGHHEDMTSETSSVGSGVPHNNLQPYLALNYCRKL